MRLFYSTASPYARKVRVVAFETGLADRIEVVATDAARDINGFLVNDASSSKTRSASRGGGRPQLASICGGAFIGGARTP